MAEKTSDRIGRGHLVNEYKAKSMELAAARTRSPAQRAFLIGEVRLFNPRLPVPTTISKRPSVSTDCERLRSLPRWEAYTRRHPQGGRDGQRGAGAAAIRGTLGHQQRRVAVSDTSHPVSPRRQVSCKRGNDPESERSQSASCRRIGHHSRPLWALRDLERL